MNETTEDKLKDATAGAGAQQKKSWPNTFFYTSSHLRMKLPGDAGVQTATDFLYLMNLTK